MNNFITNDTMRRIGTALSTGLVLLAAHWATPAAAGGGSQAGGGIEFGQGMSNLYGGGGIGGGVDSYSMQATTPTIAFGQTVEGMLGDGDEVYLDSGQLADFYLFSTKAPKTTYTITAASTEFPMDSVVYVLDPKQQGYVALQEANVFIPESPEAQYGGSLPWAGEYAIQISSASTELQNGGYAVNLTGAPDDVLDTPSGGGGSKPSGGVGDVQVQGNAGGIQTDGIMIQGVKGGGAAGGEF